MRAAGVIFDMDGLLIDSEPIWDEIDIEIFARVGVRLTPADCLLTRGLRSCDVVRYWFERQPWSDPSVEEVEAQIVTAMAEAIADRAVALPGARLSIELAAAQGMPLAVASSSSLQLIEAGLARLGVRDRFAVVVSAADEAQGKPHPDVYLTAARKLGVDAGSCVALEDSLNGVRSAKAAGMRCIAVPSDGQRDGIADIADVVLDSLEDLTPALLHPHNSRQWPT